MLSFTDSQIKETTGQMLAASTKMDSLQKSQDTVAGVQKGYQDLDNANAVYTTSYLGIIAAYHAEYKYISGVLKTDPTTATITEAGKLTTGNAYFPNAPVWEKFQPKLADEAVGLPTSVFAGTEQSTWTPINSWIALLKTGFTSGSASQSYTGLTNLGGTYTALVSSTTGFSVGDTVLVYDTGTGFANGTITLVTVGVSIDYTVNYSGGILLTTGTITNHDSGFSLSERETGGVSGGRGAYLAYLKTSIDSAVAPWATVLGSELTALNSNEATTPYSASIVTAKANVAAAQTAITTWQALPANGTGTSRYGNNIDTYIVNTISTRTSQIATRVTDITTALGSVSQIPDGTYTGTAYYLKLFDNLNLRLNKTGGTLRQYYQQSLVGSAFGQQADLTKNASTRDSQTFLVKLFAENANGSDTVTLKDVGSLSASESVKIMTNTLAVITTTIVSITDTKVQLAASIPATYTTDDQARLVVQLA